MSDAPASRPPSDAWRIIGLLLIAVSIRGFTVANTTVPSRDCIVFVRDGLQLESPPVEDGNSSINVLKRMEHPPGYPLAIVAMAHLVRPIMGGETVYSMGLSAQLVSLVAGTLIVLPMFWLVRRAYDRNVALAATAIYVVLPVNVEVTSDGISDGLYLLTAAFAMWFTVRAHDAVSAWRAFAFGVVGGAWAGAGYWIRPDAAIVALACGLTFAGALVDRLRHGGRARLPLVAGLGLVLGFACLTGPYVVTIGKLTNKRSGGELFKTISGEERDKTFFDRPETRRAVDVPLAAWYNPATDAGTPKVLWAAKALASEYFKAAHYSVAVLAALGLWIHRRRLTQAPVAVLALVGAIQFGVLFLLAWRVDYVSQRHTLLAVLVSCAFAGAALPVLGGWVRRNVLRMGEVRDPWRQGAVIAVLIMISALARDFRSLHRDRGGFKAAGEWLAKEDPEANVPIVDPFGWTEWYAGRTLRQWPNPNPKADKDLYLVFEIDGKSPHSRLGHYAFVRDLRERAVEVFRKEMAGRTAVVYRYTHPKQTPKKKKKKD